MTEIFVPYLETELQPVTLKMPKNKELVAVIFSKDRPLQLDLCLSSLRLCCRDINLLQEVVIYKASNDEFKDAYKIVIEEHPWTNFVEETVFKQNLLDSLRDKRFVLFLCDDAICVDKFSIGEVIQCLNDNYSSIGFSLRLGTNTNYCFSLDQSQKIPNFKYKRYTNSKDDIIFYDWQKPKAEFDFNYVLEVSSSVYRISDLYEILQVIEYDNPNNLEAYLAYITEHFAYQKPYIYCYIQSKCFCVPVNRVQNVALLNRTGDNTKYTSVNLLKEYQNKRRIDPKRFLGFIPNAAHELIDLF